MKPVDVEKLRALTEPVVAGLGYELVDLEWKRETGSWVLRLFIDRPGSTPGKPDGVTLEDCATVSRQLSATLDVADEISVAYSLEVSSPGVDRPLRKEADFVRFAGQKAKIKTRRPIPEPDAPSTAEATRRNFSGRLLGVEGGAIRIDVGDKEYRVPLDAVEKANLVYEF
jgi:ribosome maturation factor RimP